MVRVKKKKKMMAEVMFCYVMLCFSTFIHIFTESESLLASAPIRKKGYPCCVTKKDRKKLIFHVG